MASVHDVAAEILAKKGRMDTWRLQKLVYYAQAVSVATTSEPLYAERIEAWRNGPVVPALYDLHRQRRTIDSIPKGNPDQLTSADHALIDRTLELYGDRTGDWLSKQTHIEEPWRAARPGLHPKAPSNAQISVESMRAYYSQILNDPRVDEALADPPDAADFMSADDIRARYPELQR
jgi:uncharacterized phage-associated protein